MKNGKRGFTLAEIIICIVLIAIIGTISIVGITRAVANKETKEYSKLNKNLLAALEVYLSTHEEVEENLMLNSKAAVITLETLKKEGLISDDLYNPITKEKLDYTDNYFTLLEGKVVSDTEIKSDANNTSCDYNQIGINIINTWDLKNLKNEDVIYVCPRKDYTEEIKALQDKVDELSSELENIKSNNNNSITNSDSPKDKLKIDTLFNDLTYTAKGVNPNNYVYFEVTSKPNEFAYFPNTANKGLWRIISINTENEIELVYTEPVLSNNFSNYTSKSSQWCDPWLTEEERLTDCTFYQLAHTPNGLSTSKYYKYDNNTKWLAEEIIEDVTVSGSKKSYLYNSIKNKDWIVSKKYFPNYTVNSTSAEISFNSSKSIQMKMGQVNYNQINSSINISESWLYNYKMLLGYSNVSKSFDDYYFYIYNNAGTLQKLNRLRMANRCTSNSCNKDKDSSSHWRMYTGDYYPLITLNSKVELEEPNCTNGQIKGSKECPYRLTCNNC